MAGTRSPGNACLTTDAVFFYNEKVKRKQKKNTKASHLLNYIKLNKGILAKKHLSYEL